MRENKIQYRLNKTEKILISFSVFHEISKLFLGTFVVSFLMHNSINEIVSVSVYNLFFYFAIMITFVLMVDKCKRGNIKTVFGSHICVQMILIILIAILGVRAANWVMVLGMLYGIQQALYAMSEQQLVIDKVQRKRMIFFYGTNVAIATLAKILIPIALGALITVGTLQNVAWIMMIMGAIEFYMLAALPTIQHHDTNKSDLSGFIKRSLTLPCMRKLFLAEFLRGLAYVLEMLGVVYIVYVFQTDMNLGTWTTFFAILAATATWLFGHFCSKHDFKWIIGLCSTLLIGAIIFLIIDVNHLSVIAYAGILTLAMEMMDQVASVNILNLAKTKYITRRYRAEYLASRQVVSFIGRWGGILATLYIGVFGGYDLLPYLIVILAISKTIGAFIYVRLGKYISDY